jgi:glycosyltransferase involved in cell wall biosynthesis
MGKLKILIVQELWWPKGEGGLLATHLITKMLTRRGFEVKVVTGVKDYEVINGVEFIYEPRLKADSKLRLWINIYALCKEDWFKRLIEWADIVYIPRYAYPVIPAAKALRRRVIVHLHDYQPISYTAVIFHNDRFKSDFTRTFYYESHQHDLAKALITSPLTLINRLARRWVSQADMIICVSNRQREIIEEKMPEVKGRTTVIYNPLPNIPFIGKKLTNEKILLYLGGSSFVKGFYVLIRAVMNIMRQGSNTSFLLIGEGFKHGHEVLVKKLNDAFKGEVKLFRRLSHNDVLKLYSKSHAVLIPSICEEPFPYVVLETMLTGTLPVASRVGGIPEIIEGTDAERFMFAPGCSEEMADKIETALSLSQDQLINVGSKLREVTLKRFSNEVTEKRLLEVFNI